ncbi:hypothetical protein [Streptomyces tirandamycinicus]|uniref:Uncharacterized protein n=1 Tax=Streptomyces tirandamycinicus TaxID=2174846 RepID=A0A2S1T212_9ACTN|nr:hypothetical protein [Streptomyces tirandamycinicus]AWI32646.1 hypothetical protein DDW44_30470 [Streptomyces tirandamycinicus]
MSVLPYVPAVFTPGDRITLAQETHTRDERGHWACDTPLCPSSFTDDEMRRFFADPRTLAQVGPLMIAPADLAPGDPLPGRVVESGEDPFELSRPYLMAGTAGPSHMPFQPLRDDVPGPWGFGQRTRVSHKPLARMRCWQMTLTPTGVVWLRLPSGTGTYAYIPADEPGAEQIEALMTVAVLRAAFPAGAVAIEPDRI